jgi:hypothetical protein
MVVVSAPFLVEGGPLEGRGVGIFLISACCVGAAAHLHARHVRLPIRSSSGSHAFMNVGKYLFQTLISFKILYMRGKKIIGHMLLKTS